MKKGFVALLVILAVIVLVSPAIIGRLAEKSMDQNLELAVTENDDVAISSQGFERGWFTSEGQHRIEPKPGQQWAAPSQMFDDNRRYVTAVIVDTTIDHGLIPVTSMSREMGSLAPGLGSAVSTLSLELDDGSVTPLPGVIYSEMGLTGELRSNLVVDSDSAEFDGRILDWSDVDLVVTINPLSQTTTVNGLFDSLSMTSVQETIRVGRVDIDGSQQPGPFGFPVGSIDVSMQSVAIKSDNNDIRMGPIRVASGLTARGDRIDGSAQILLDNFESPLGTSRIDIDMRLENADGEALGKVIRAYEAADEKALDYEAMMYQNNSIFEFLAAGMELHFDRFNVTLPQGVLQSTLNMSIAESNSPDFSWAALLLAIDATLDLQMSQGLVDLITSMEPQAGAIVGLGYLRKEGDVYKTFIEVKSGVVTINGAPMQIPLTALQ